MNQTKPQSAEDNIWKIEPKYKFLEIIGYGAYSTVARAQNLQTDQIVAIKKFTNFFAIPEICKTNLREIAILRQCNNPQIAKLLDIIYDEEVATVYLVMEYQPYTLRQLVDSDTHLSKECVKYISYNIILGLLYLHYSSIMHRDLKPSNILLDEECNVKLIDFGLSRSLPNEEDDDEDAYIQKIRDPKINKFQCRKRYYTFNHTNTFKKELDDSTKSLKKENSLPKNQTKEKQEFLSQKRSTVRKLSQHVCTRWYRPPEIILLQKKYNEKIDIWSLGCILLELQLMLEENCRDTADRNPILFRGKYCHPLSPINSKKKNAQDNDQLSKILDVLGIQNSEQLCFIEDNEAYKYLQEIQQNKRLKPDWKKKIIPKSSSKFYDLIDKMLQFNPNDRVSIKQVIQHQYFDSVRQQWREVVYLDDIEIDFDDLQIKTEEQLKQLFENELEQFQKKQKSTEQQQQ